MTNVDITHSARPLIQDGTPNVDGLIFDELIVDAQLYMRRHYLTSSKESSVRLHHILRSDAGLDLHDHPWDFISLILVGEYTETTPTGDQTYGPGSLLIRQAEDLHRLTLNEPVWTYVATGPVRRKWGFQTSDGWQHWPAYHQLHKHSTSGEPPDGTTRTRPRRRASRIW